MSAMLRPVVAPLEIFPAGSFVLHNNIFPDSRRKHEAAKRGGGWQISSWAPCRYQQYRRYNLSSLHECNMCGVKAPAHSVLPHLTSRGTRHSVMSVLSPFPQ